MKKVLKAGYHRCWIHGLSLHAWYSGLTNQEFETHSPNALIPPEQFLCCKCAEEENE